jgi:hypothetical protein
LPKPTLDRPLAMPSGDNRSSAAVTDGGAIGTGPAIAGQNHMSLDDSMLASEENPDDLVTGRGGRTESSYSLQ